MNLKSLTKEQKQKYALTAIVAVASIFALKQFVLSPLLASHAAAKEELSDLQTKLAQAEAVIKRHDDVERALGESTRKLRDAAQTQMPNPDNALAWAHEVIYAQARALGIDPESVSDLELDVNLFTSKEQEKRNFKPYGVRLATQCTYFELERFIADLEKANPNIVISGFTISGQGTKPERHQIMLNIEWPSWKNAEKARPYLEESARAPV